MLFIQIPTTKEKVKVSSKSKHINDLNFLLLNVLNKLFNQN